MANSPSGWEAWLHGGLALLRLQARSPEPRETELQELVQRWRAGPFCTVIVGPPGIGKSYLAGALARRLGVRLLSCEARDSTRLSPLEPLISLLHRELGLERTAPAAVKESRLRGPLLELLTPGLTCTNRQRRGQASAGLLMLRRLARETPVLFLAEDVELADASTQEFLKTLAAHRLVGLIATSQRGFGGWPELTLGPLDLAGCTALVQSAGLPEEAARRLIETSSGIPLELTEAIANARIMLRANPKLAWTRLPTRLRDVVAARLLRLGPLGAQLARLTACLEPPFTWSQVLDVAPLWMDPTAAEPLWQRLLEKGLLVPREGGYAFAHDGVREEVYHSIDGATRVRLHQRVAERNRRHWEEERPELLAFHYTRAGLVTQAGELWQRAASRAASRGALHEAVGHLQQALALGGDPSGELELRITLGRLLVATRGYGDAQVECNYREALELSESQPASFRAVHGLLLYYMVRGHVYVAERLARRCLEMCGDDPDDRIEAELASGVSDFYFGRTQASRARLHGVLALYDEERHARHRWIFGQDPRVVSLCYCAWGLALEGRLHSARTLALEAVEAAERLKHPFSLAIALHFQAIVAMLCGDPQATLAASDRGVAHSRSEGVRFFEADTAILGGWAMVHSGQPEAGMTRMRAGLTGVRALGAELGWPFVLSLLIDCTQGEDALELLAEALAQAEAMQHFSRPLLECLRGEKSGSLAALEEARVQARECGWPWIELRALVAWSRLRGEPHPDLPALLERLPEAADSVRAREAASFCPR